MTIIFVCHHARMGAFFWISQPVDDHLVVRQTEERTGEDAIRWMNVTRYLKTAKTKRAARSSSRAKP